MEDKIYHDFSLHFWNTLEKSKNLLHFLPKKISITFSFEQWKWQEIKSILPEISNLENILLRLRIFWLKNSGININKILNSLHRLHPEKWLELEQIKKNIKFLEEKNEISMGLKVNNNEYKKTKDIIEYILHWSLLHDDIEKRKHYNALFQNNPFIRDLLYSDILEWVLKYIKYVLFELDLTLQNTIFQKPITREEYLIKLEKNIKFKDSV